MPRGRPEQEEDDGEGQEDEEEEEEEQEEKAKPKQPKQKQAQATKQQAPKHKQQQHKQQQPQPKSTTAPRGAPAKYTVMYYKAHSVWAIRQCFGLKRQICQWSTKGYECSVEDLGAAVKLGLDALNTEQIAEAEVKGFVIRKLKGQE
jgi:hypothetical protein